MIVQIRNSKITKGISIFLLITLITEIINPLQLHALTAGPSQPEMAGFTPMNTDGMVDMFSGNFHYTIPIMTVPGPNGGYPINLNYNSGIGMEHEASWVGLGWNLNPGAINRQVRGLPDDFNGERVQKTYKRRDNKTIIFSPGIGVELAGANFDLGLKTTASLVYNTYAGMSMALNFGVSASYVRKRNILGSAGCGLGAGLTLDSDNGVSPSFSMNGGSKDLKYAANFGYNSKSGNYSFGNQISYTHSWLTESYNKETDETTLERSTLGGRLGRSFSSAAGLPPIHVPMTNSSFGLSLQGGGQVTVVELHGILSANVCTQKTPENTISTSAYGLIYSENAGNASLRDFNREKELVVDKNSMNLPLPVLTYDVYNIAGENLNGSFRAYRSDMGYVCDNMTYTQSSATTIGGDASFGEGFQAGVDITENAGYTSAGMWADETFDGNLRHKSKSQYAAQGLKNISPVLYEPFYFKMLGEQTSVKVNPLDYVGGESPTAYVYHTNFTASLIPELNIPVYTTNNLIKKSDNTAMYMSKYALAERNKRTQLIEYRTNAELNHSTPARKGYHIGEISVVNSNGERYTYGETLYNISEKEVTFSIRPQQPLDFSKSTTEGYEPANANGSQRVGKEKLYSCTETPAYAYSYLITSITSPDYVDFDNDGKPSDGDLGYWVKFNYNRLYSETNAYNWRFPYVGANLMLGDISYGKDDKGSYNYGTKEIAYVSKIETKTHFAKLYTSPRKDGYEAYGELSGGRGTKTLHKLDSILLFSKNDTLHPIKAAVFEYDYSLCKNVPNNAISGQGKLTLLRVYFKYNESGKGKNAPYEFYYNHNANYNAVNMDRWGNYKGDANYFEHYVTQNKADADAWAKVWNMDSIKLPSGGSIKVNYESDDYAYVQDKQALQMVKINGKTKFNKEGGRFYIYFDKEPAYNASKYVSNFKDNLMFFKAAVKAEDNENPPDYVQGYIKIDPATASDVSTTIGRVQVIPFGAYNQIHPIYLLCCQYLKNNRPDILFGLDDMDDNASDLRAFCNALFSRGMKAKAEMLFDKDNFYKFCLKENLFKTLVTNSPQMPSYVRLNVPSKIKYGGGHRVKSITLNDRWNKSEPNAYTQEYYYRTLENGVMISSGVAEYEPMVCAEETALRYPVYDPATGDFFKEDEIYSEHPYGESYFPAASVGYSKVIVKTAVQTGVTKATSGIQVQEFYTAKDFPVIVSQTMLDKKLDVLPNVLKMITIGFKQVSSSAYSQGYAIELNDMHGKPKSMATYPWRLSNSDETLLNELAQLGATTRIDYHYKTKYAGGRIKPDNLVDVLVADNKVEKQTMGQTFDYIVDFRENHSYSEGIGSSINGGLMNWVPPIPFGSVIPSYDMFEESVRSVAAVKVIYSTAILESTTAVNNGSKVVTRNLQWDPYTGKPLLTAVTNDFDQPVYQYSQPAYWNHPNMGAASDNYRAYFEKGKISPSLLAGYFEKYDKIDSDKTLRNAPASTTFQYWNSSGYNNDFSNYSAIEVWRSRKSNQLNAVSASTVSLSNPGKARKIALLERFNVITISPTDTMQCFKYYDCNGDEHCGRIVVQNNNLYFIKNYFCTKPSKECTYNACASTFNASDLVNACAQYISVYVGNKMPDNIFSYSFTKVADSMCVYKRSNKSFVTSFKWNDPLNIFPECMDGVLQASAVEFNPVWKFDYADAGITTTVSPGKENYFCIPNRYRSLRSNLFPVNRRQEGGSPFYRTNIAYDGTFDFFQWFNAQTGNQNNKQDPWTWTAEITSYSPYNFELENKNALGIYSAALYGYGNSLATAVANNARYYEIGFDGFENERSTGFTLPRGHLTYTLPSGSSISSDYAHTGDYSIKLSAGTQFDITAKLSSNDASYTAENGQLTLMRGKKYILSFWARTHCKAVNNLGENYTISVNNVNQPNVTKEAKIDCWQRVEVEFTAPATGASVTLKIIPPTPNPAGGNYYFDDIRVLPYNAGMKSYVYHPVNYRLLAELDENNYASFYNYDEEGILVQVKKETERGIMTIQTTRQNLRGKK